MASVPKVIDKITDIDDLPEVARIVEEVGKSGEVQALRLHGETLAILSPVGVAGNYGPSRVKTQEDFEAFVRAAGSWKDVDTDKFLEDIYESRNMPPRPPVDL